MRVFEKMNTSGKEVCPICKTKEDKSVVLIGIKGTQKGHNIQAVQVHLDCLELIYDKEHNAIYQILETQKQKCCECGEEIEKGEGHYVNCDRTELYCEYCSGKKIGMY
jgi:hypothetical protein